MAGRFITLYTLPAPAAAEGTPVLITKGELLMDRFTEKLFIRIGMQSLDERTIHTVKICLQLFDEVGAPIDSAVEYLYGSLNVKRDQKFGEIRTIPIQNANVRSFSALLIPGLQTAQLHLHRKLTSSQNQNDSSEYRH